MASDEEDHTDAVYIDEDFDEEDDDESEGLQNQQIDVDDVDLIDDVEEEEEDGEEEAEEDDSNSSPAGEVTIAVAGIPNTAAVTPTATLTPTSTAKTSVVRTDSNAIVEIKKPLAVDDSRRLFQRLWTDEDEIELLQGFLDYITQRGTNNSHHHDTTAFYDQIKGKLQLDFNKNQLVEKLRRLKKKYRNVLSKISSGKEYVFKSPHDQATFDLSCKIWNETAAAAVPISAAADVGIDDVENHFVNPNMSFNLNDHNGNEFADPNYVEKKAPRSRKRSRTASVATKIEENYNQQQQQQQQYGQGVGTGIGVADPATLNVVEETVKSCLLPLFKELVNNSPNGGGLRGFGGMNMNMNPFGDSMNFSIGDMNDEKWRKQHILELEVYSKRLELMQDQIKTRLDELRSIRS
ncbi:probable transcription factor At5g28040 [Rutidosis leptorrhynchoides]|uniref:probable transcription factor At5g28040 n=1 Tax=Rutidosis leptorrhynchoides TaxID=125765 RepID=UPI003A9A081C